MTIPTDTPVDRSCHYLIDASESPDRSWRLIAAHHLLTSRHIPQATMSIIGIDQFTARRLRMFATDLGLSGLRIPDDNPPSDALTIDLPQPFAAPSVICELVAMSIEATGSAA